MSLIQIRTDPVLTKQIDVAVGSSDETSRASWVRRLIKKELREQGLWPQLQLPQQKAEGELE